MLNDIIYYVDDFSTNLIKAKTITRNKKIKLLLDL